MHWLLNKIAICIHAHKYGNNSMSRIGYQVRKIFSSLGYELKKIDELTQLANRFGSDKGTLNRSRHGYTRVYDKYFGEIRDNEISLLELGLLRPDVDSRREHAGFEGTSATKGAYAPSLEMWANYFSSAAVTGFDIDEFPTPTSERIRIFKGDMSNREDLATLVSEFPDGFDIIIDDGSHVSHHQQICLGFLFSHLKPGGYYIIEDLHWQDPTYEREGITKTREILNSFKYGRKINGSELSEDEVSFIRSNIEWIQFFDSMEEPDASHCDAMAIIRRKN